MAGPTAAAGHPGFSAIPAQMAPGQVAASAATSAATSGQMGLSLAGSSAASIVWPIAAFMVANSLMGSGKTAQQVLQENAGDPMFSQMAQQNRGVVGTGQASAFSEFLDKRGVRGDITQTDYEGLGSAFSSATGREGEAVAPINVLFEQFQKLNEFLPTLQETADTTLAGMGVSVDGLTEAFNDDGVLDAVESTQLGFANLGEVTPGQFEKIVNAVDQGAVSLDALTGKTQYTQQEMINLAAIGAMSMQEVAAATGLTTQAIENAISRVGSFADEWNSLSDRSVTLTVSTVQRGESYGSGRAIGDARVPKDQIAPIHRGEMVIDSRSAQVLREYGIKTNDSAIGKLSRKLDQMRGGDSPAVVKQLKALNQSMRELSDALGAGM
jgi:hypothetical protein